MEIEFLGKFSLAQIKFIANYIQDNQMKIILMERPIYVDAFKISKIGEWKRLVEVE